MRNLNIFYFFLGILMLNACSNEVAETFTYKINEPVFMNMTDFRNSVQVKHSDVKIEKQGKIAFFEGFMYISEPEKGIHIIDNRTPESPSNIGFIELLGNVDLSIKNNILYADSYIDLVWFDINSPSDPKLLGRKENVFPTALPMPDNEHVIDYEKSNDKSQGIVIGWNVTERTEKYIPHRRPWWQWGFESDMATSPNLSTGSGAGGVGLTGSMSRFAIYDKYLYTVLNNFLGIFDIEQITPEKKGENIHVGNVETIFSYKDNLFFGMPTGMMIYSVADPLKPEYQSMITHALGCDPVVVENDMAYVTIHSGNFCNQNNNQLLIIDVKDVKYPEKIKTYEMTKPKGLGIDNDILFVCDDGLKIFNAKGLREGNSQNPETLKANLIAHFKEIDKKPINGYDLIPFENLLMMIAEDGIYQYDYSDLKNIRQLSKIPIGK